MSEIAVSPRRVMIVDDHVDTCELTAQLIELRGHEASCHFTVMSALAALPTFRPHVVLVDVDLPDRDGLALVGELRTRPECIAARIIVVTGHAMPGMKERSLAAGANVYLSKPVARHGLMELIEAP